MWGSKKLGMLGEVRRQKCVMMFLDYCQLHVDSYRSVQIMLILRLTFSKPQGHIMLFIACLFGYPVNQCISVVVIKPLHVVVCFMCILLLFALRSVFMQICECIPIHMCVYDIGV